MFSNALTDSQHFYIHVNGEPKSGNPNFGGVIFADGTNNVRDSVADFGSSGQNPGILAKRPDNYVPFLVPLYDEANSELQTQAYRKLKADNPDKTYETPDPIYKWVYRPEMQFTSYDLKVSEINKIRDENEDGTIDATETINILNDETPLIPSDSIVTLLYNLSTTDLLPLDYFNAGTEKELIFAVGEQEIRATLGADQKLTFDDLSHLELLTPDDYLTIRLYANNDLGNTLWQYAFKKNGLHVSYKIPHDKTEITLELNAANTSERVRTLGGIRLEYEYILPAGAYFNGTNDFIKWRMGVPGRYCSDFGVDSTSCTDDTAGTLVYQQCHTVAANNNTANQATRCAMYWEPLDPANTSETLWNTSLNASAMVDVEFTRLDGSDAKVDLPFTVETRELFPVTATRTNPYDGGSTNPIEGEDVEMLVQVLWQLGLSPQYGYAGVQGDLIGTGTVPDPSGNTGTSLEVFTTGYEFHCVTKGTSTNRRVASVEKLVRRFQGAHTYVGTSYDQACRSSGNGNPSTAAQSSPQTMDRIAAGDTSNGIVDDLDFLPKLKTHYNQYIKSIMHGSYANRDNLPVDNNAVEVNVWANTAITAGWDANLGNGSVYTNTVHQQIYAGDTATRTDLLRSWIEQEAGAAFWGARNLPYRLTMGGADEFGSLGFNQIIFQFVYGANRSCTDLNALSNDQFSQYEPQINASNMTKFMALPRSRGVGNPQRTCGTELNRAFNENNLRVNYDNAVVVDLPQIRGYCRFVTGNTDCTGATYTQPLNNQVIATDYDQIAKGIAAYNGGPGMLSESWPGRLLRRNPAAINHEQREHYSIGIRQNAGLRRRHYALQWTVTAADAQANQNLNQGQHICFLYGEDNWHANESWSSVLHNLTGLNDSRVVNCNTGIH